MTTPRASVFLWVLLFPALIAQAAHPKPTMSVTFDGNAPSSNNGAARVPGVHGQAVGLDAKKRQSEDLNRAIVNTASSFSVSAWVKVNALDGPRTFVSQDGQTVSAFTLGKYGDHNRFAFTMPGADSAAAPPAVAESAFAPTPGLWYELTGVYDKTNAQIRLYANGLRVGSAAFTTPWTATGHVIIGRGLRDGKFADFADGAVDEMRFYPHALSDAEAGAAYDAERNSLLPHTFTWANPIYFQGKGRNDDVRDPAIMQDGGTYYLVYTMWPFRNYTDRDPKLPDMGSSPGIALYASRDLKAWTFQTWILKSADLPNDCPYKHQFWAPEIHKINGRFYVIFGGSNWINDKYNIGGHIGYYQFVGVADNIVGPYKHFTALQGPGVDTSLFQDDDGKTYVVWPRNEVHAVDLSQINQGKITVGPKLSQAATDADFKALGEPVPETIEGPFMVKRAGTYYCFFAETYRGPDGFYATGVATAKSLAGPWTLDPRWRVFPGGHQALFIGPDGRFWTSYKHEESDAAPWLNIDPIDFDTQGNVQVTPTQGLQTIRLR